MSTPTETINVYIEATRSGDVDKLKSVFASGALMSGFFEGEFYSGSPDLFFEEVRDNPSPAETGSEYVGEITYEEVVGRTAQITMKEKGYLGVDIINLFHLANINGTWLILSKTYTDV
jgi:hypothetical protein